METIFSTYFVLNKVMQSKSSGTMSDKFNYQHISFSCHYHAQWCFNWSHIQLPGWLLQLWIWE